MSEMPSEILSSLFPSTPYDPDNFRVDMLEPSSSVLGFFRESLRGDFMDSCERLLHEEDQHNIDKLLGEIFTVLSKTRIRRKDAPPLRIVDK